MEEKAEEAVAGTAVAGSAPEVEADSERAAPEAPPSEEPRKEPKKKWYVVHAQSGMENKVQANLEKRIKTLGVSDRVFRILIPTEVVAEMRDGKRKISRRKIFPGYVLVEMLEGDEEAWYVIRNTPGVTNFVGANGRPQALTESEVNLLLQQSGLKGETEKPKVKPKLEIEVGESVRITDGPFRDFVGKVEETNPDRGKVKVMVTIFGRTAPVELDFMQIAKL
ncbi:MAG: transcription termination/antitermination factor NusG [Candidatus Hydrogenedentota bacterium]|nr:MAG: transcription termination/antitermination factor NusG [Candidatus Hydrogenedentota bacterium]